MIHGLADYGHYPDYDNDPIFYHPELNKLATWSQFKVLIPESYGWIVVGYL